MTIRNIRAGVFETNSSSSHSLTIDANAMRNFDMIADAIKDGELVVPIDRYYGWEWERLYRPESKIAYLISQCGANALSAISETEFDDRQATEKLRHVSSRINEILAAVEETTQIKVVVSVKDNDGMFGVDHDSSGVGLDLCEDPEKMLDFIFSETSFVQLGNDNRDAPVMMPTDKGDPERSYPDHYTDNMPTGVPISFFLDVNNARIEIDGEPFVIETGRFGVDVRLGVAMKGVIATRVRATVLQREGYLARRRQSPVFDPDVHEARHMAVANQAIHELIARVSEPQGIRIVEDLDIEVSVEARPDVYSESAELTFEGFIPQDAIELLQSAIRAELEREPGISP